MRTPAARRGPLGGVVLLLALGAPFSLVAQAGGRPVAVTIAPAESTVGDRVTVTLSVDSPAGEPQFPDPGRQVALASRSAERASLYLERVPPAIAGQHGDVRTFQVCCRLVRGFALTEDEALTALAAWNARCQPPWTEAELRNKLRGARQYGREPVGGLL